MNREQFMKQLSYLLQDISDEDRTDALDYYENYLDEAGFGYETDITNEFGSPERIAAIIRTSLLSNPDETGEFTDSGYENSRFKDPGYELAEQHRETDTFTGADRSKHPYTSCGSESGQTYGQAQQSRSSFHPGAERSGPRTSRLLKLLLWIVLLIVGAPLLLGIGGSIAGLTAAIVGIAFALLITTFVPSAKVNVKSHCEGVVRVLYTISVPTESARSYCIRPSSFTEILTPFSSSSNNS